MMTDKKMKTSRSSTVKLITALILAVLLTMICVWVLAQPEPLADRSDSVWAGLSALAATPVVVAAVIRFRLD